jgi:riboflavin kinase / FMN adenylyltransferase
MNHYRSMDDIHLDNACLTIGSFDGLHRGHQEIIRQLTAGARSSRAPAVVLTFYPSPSVVLGKRPRPNYLTTQDELAVLLEGLGVDVLITHPFDRDVAALSARDFLARLKDHLGFRHLWVGYDFAMGRNREGDLPALGRIGEEISYELHTVQAVELDGGVVSSSRIRSLIAEGHVGDASALLGRSYHLEGVVIQGQGRGKSIGVPTANLSVPPERALPGAGVYVCRARVPKGTFGAAANIGVRPTFENEGAEVTVEAHLLDFKGDLYGRSMSLEFVQRIRGERRFPDSQALVAQIQADIATTRQVLRPDGFQE